MGTDYLRRQIGGTKGDRMVNSLQDNGPAGLNTIICTAFHKLTHTF